MPTYRGLEVAQRRHGFKTIINLFPEHTDAAKPRFPGGAAVRPRARDPYLLSPEDPDEADAFLDRTLAAGP